VTRDRPYTKTWESKDGLARIKYLPEYLSEPMLGYVLAHLAWFRDEDGPAWAKALRWVPRAALFATDSRLDLQAGPAAKDERGVKPNTHEALGVKEPAW
jgi:hypothetical protein